MEGVGKAADKQRENKRGGDNFFHAVIEAASVLIVVVVVVYPGDLVVPPLAITSSVWDDISIGGDSFPRPSLFFFSSYPVFSMVILSSRGR